MSSWGDFSSMAKSLTSGLKEASSTMSSNLKGASDSVTSGLKGASDTMSSSLKEASNSLNGVVSTTVKSTEKLTESLRSLDLSQLDLDRLQTPSEDAATAVPPENPQRTERQVIVDEEQRALDICYFTNKLVGMGFPNPKHKRFDARRVATYLNNKHKGNYMVWNLSEKVYDYSLFQGQIIDFKFPGHPAPPLGMLVKMCTSIESWLNTDPKHVAVIHCLTGKGRTVILSACFLAWMGEQASALEALQYVCDKKEAGVERLTIPTQRRYVHFFENVMDGVKPKPEPLQLRRVIINSVPDMASSTAVPAEGETAASIAPGCRPYLQIFKNGKLLYSSTWSNASPASDGQGGGDTQIPFYSVDEGTVSFKADCILQGDILLRCKHLDKGSGSTYSMFRAGFHTGYVPAGVLRLSAAQLDSASADPRFGTEFFVDLIFAPVPTKGHPITDAQDALVESATVPVADQEQYDDLIDSNNEFWDEVAFRKTRKEALNKMPKKENNNTFSLSDGEEEEDHVHHDAAEKAKKTDELKMQLEALTFTDSEPIPASPMVAPPQPAPKLDAADMAATTGGDKKEREDSVDYLDELEELEKQLGLEPLGDLSAGLKDSPTPPPPSGVGAASDDGIDAKGEAVKRSFSGDDDDDVDELENFLNGL